jgi:hypothetical protein
MRKLLTVALAMALLVLAVPLQAAPPETIEEPVFFIFPDFEYGLAVFWNVTREEFCDWEDSGFAGPPPAGSLIEVTYKETGQGAIVQSFRATGHLELWTLDDDASLEGPCQDTDDQTAPLAVGEARVALNDNDLEASGTRTNSFGDRGQGKVIDGDGGRWHYSWVFHALIDKDGFFTVAVENSNLVRMGR